MTYYCFTLLILSLFLFYFYSREYIKILASVEFGTLVMIVYYIYNYSLDVGISIYLLILGVCEGVLGLIILSVYNMDIGSDYVYFGELLGV